MLKLKHFIKDHAINIATRLSSKLYSRVAILIAWSFIECFSLKIRGGTRYSNVSKVRRVSRLRRVKLAFEAS